MRIFARTEYDGTNFNGWQVQHGGDGRPRGITIQQEIQNAVSKICGEEIEIVGAGRTDAGVHAKRQGFHFDVSQNILDFDKLTYKINSVLPTSIAVFEMQEVADDFHARFSAVERVYHYYISLKKNPLSFNQAVHFGYKLDLDKLKAELQTIVGTHSFESFCSTNNQLDHFRCTIKTAEIVNLNDDFFYIKFSANRFLYNMVRSLVGTLIDISRGKTDTSILEIIAKNDRKSARFTAPAKGLVLEDVKYQEFL